MSRTERLMLGSAIAIGVLVRLLPVVGAAAAVGDGGLFLSMVDDIRAAGGLPPVTTYNHLDIPFLYPPLALLGGAAVGGATGATSLDVLRWMPLIVSVAGVITFAWLARRVLDPLAAIAATFAYALMPHAYDWVIAGGGLTRGAGLLFAMAACAIVAGRSAAPRWAPVAAGVLLGLSALSHPQAPIFGVIGCVVFSWEPPVRAWLRKLAIAALAAALVVLPWLGWVIATQGLDALLSVAHRLDPATGLVRMMNLRFSGAQFMDVIGVLGVLGLVAAIARRRFRLPILLLATYLTGAGGGEFMGVAAWALLAGVGGAEVFALVAGAMREMPARRQRILGASVASVALFMALVGALGAVTDKSSKLHAISADHVLAMRWLASNAPEDAVTIVPTNEWWGDDEVSEWLPAIGERASYGTVQGSEWLGAPAFRAQEERYTRILHCMGSTAACYGAIDSNAWLFVPKGRLSGPFSPSDCCPALRSTLTEFGYEIVYDGPGATIARRGG